MGQAMPETLDMQRRRNRAVAWSSRVKPPVCAFEEKVLVDNRVTAPQTNNPLRKVLMARDSSLARLVPVW